MRPWPFYIGSILLEPNRWKKDKQPSYQVSDWLPRFKKAGLAGIELWENHAALATPEEVAKLAAGDPPVTIFNSYAALTDAAKPQRELAAKLTHRLKATGVKFNFGNNKQQSAEELKNLREWSTMMPANTWMLCECHGGTIAETPDSAHELLESAGLEKLGAMVHPFLQPAAELDNWFKELGGRIRHLHIQMRSEKDKSRIIAVRDRAPLARETLLLARDRGFNGTATLEFAAGTGDQPEDQENLFAAALDDMSFIRETLA